MTVVVTVEREGISVNTDLLEDIVPRLMFEGHKRFAKEWEFFVEELSASIAKFECLNIVGNDVFVPRVTPDGATWTVVSRKA